VTFNKQLEELPVDRLDLSVRSFNVLRQNGIATVGQLLLLSAQDLLGFHAFGKKSLMDVQRALDQLLKNYREDRDSESSEPELRRRRGLRSNVTPGGWLCPQDISVDLDVPVGVLDLSARPRHALHLAAIKTVRQLMNFSKNEFCELQNIGRTSVAEVQLKLSNYLSGAPLVAPDTTTDRANDGASQIGTKALLASMLGRLPERARNVICDRYGLWDGITETLQDVGDKLGLTRERIRQIEQKSISRLQRVFSCRWLSELVARKLNDYSIQNPAACGVFDDDDAISAMADDCSDEEAALAMSFLNDVAFVRGGLLTHSIVEAEPGIYCLNKKLAADYRLRLDSMVAVLNKCQKPVSEAKMWSELGRQRRDAGDANSPSLMTRILSISPSLTRLRSGQIGLSRWTEFHSRSAPVLAEAALRLIGRPAHFREITAKVNELAETPGTINERRVHNAIIRTPEKFVWVGSGTYGLVAWGIQRPPYLKDRLIQLLSETRYPLPYWHLREKVLEVCNCREASIRMTLDLNTKLFKKFEGDQYGLRKHYADSEASDGVPNRAGMEQVNGEQHRGAQGNQSERQENAGEN
jgi:hypothetical protein